MLSEHDFPALIRFSDSVVKISPNVVCAIGNRLFHRVGIARTRAVFDSKRQNNWIDAIEDFGQIQHSIGLVYGEIKRTQTCSACSYIGNNLRLMQWKLNLQTLK